MKREPKILDIDSFGELMDKFIHECKFGLFVEKEEDTDEWQVHGVGLGSVMDFYIFLNALRPLLLKMLKEMDGNIEPRLLVTELSEILRKDMMEAIEEAEKKGAEP